MPGRQARTPFSLLTMSKIDNTLAYNTLAAMSEMPELFEVQTTVSKRIWYAPWRRREVIKTDKYYLQPLTARKSWRLAAMALQCAFDVQKLTDQPVHEALRIQADKGPIVLRMLAIMALPEPLWKDQEKVDKLFEVLSDTIPPSDIPKWLKWYIVQGDFRPFVQGILSILPEIDIRKPVPVDTTSSEGTPLGPSSTQSSKRTASKRSTK